MTHRNRAGDPPGRRKAAADAGHRQGFPTPPPIRPLPVCLPDRNGRFPKAFGRRPAGLAMPCIAAPRAPGRRPDHPLPAPSPRHLPLAPFPLFQSQ